MSQVENVAAESTNSPGRKNRGKLQISKTQVVFEKAGIYVIALILIIIGSMVSPQFFTVDNMLTVLRSISLLGMVVAGAAFVTYIGEYADLSIPAIIPLSGIVAVFALPLGVVPAVLLGMLAGLMIGVMNGLVIGYLRANPILWTLAVVFFMEGLMRFMMSNNQIYPDVSPGTAGADFIGMYRSEILGIPTIVVLMLVLLAISHWVLRRTKFGQQAKLVGSAYEVAKTSGINVKRTVMIAFVLTALSSSVAGILITSFNKTGVYYLGQGYDFQAVTAIVLGGMTLSGGRGSIVGVLGGVLVIGLLSNLMTFMGVHPFQQKVVIGTIFILVVGLNQYQLRKMGKDHG